MAWRIEFDPKALDEPERLERDAQRRIVRFLRKRIVPLENPRAIGEALHGKELGRFWKYRVGDYRLVCDIQHALIRVLALRVGNRKDIYR